MNYPNASIRDEDIILYFFSQKFIIEKYVKEALIEDIGHGDITVNSIVKPGQKITVRVNFRNEGILAGIDVFKLVFELLDPQISFNIMTNDGQKVEAGKDIAVINGEAGAILTAERTALNFIQRMSAIATLTAKYQQAIFPYKAKITDTRKTTPNFRIFEKYAVKAGGGFPHRFGLFDCVMIKDNHIELAGSITEAIRRVRENISHTTKIEVETENLDQVREALENNVDIIMLDNMSVESMHEAVKLIGNKAITEASGNINLDTINKVASTGINYISTSSIIAKAGLIDIGLDI